MANDCGKAEYRACVLVLTTLEADGIPEGGPQGNYVTDQFVTLATTDVFDEGTAQQLRKSCGGFALNAPAEPVQIRQDLTLTLTHPDPNLEWMLTSGVILDAAGGRPSGFGDPLLGVISTKRVALEIYTHRNDPSTGSDDASYPYERHLWPLTIKWRRNTPGEFSAGPVQPVYVGQAYENTNFKDGLIDAAGSAWPYQSAPSNRVHQAIPWGNVGLGDILPVASCNFVAAVGS